MRLHPVKSFGIAVALVTATTVITVAWQTRRVDDNAIKNAWKNGEWVTYGLNWAEQRYSPLKQIDATNVSKLALAWSHEVAQSGGPQEATPLFANGVLYGITNNSITFAIDARTGQEIWRHDPQVARQGFRMCCGIINRGVALYEGKVLVPVNDGRLEALDAATGKLLWSVRTTPIDESGRSYSLTIAPRVMKGKVIIGNAGAEFPPFRGYISAHDVNNGKELWRFYTVPGDPSKGFENKDMEAAAKTWTGEWWKYGGGGSVWDGMAYDPDTNLVYVGTGNGLPWPQDLRQGKQTERLDNLYLASILAINVDTGKLKWHFQCTPAEQWDYDAVQHLMLADIRINGRQRKVIMQVNRNGYFYVIDRTNGAFISGEPVKPVSWARGLGPKTGRPLVNPEAYYTAERGVTLALAAHITSQMAFNPATGLVYVPIAASGTADFRAIENATYDPSQSFGIARGGSAPFATPPAYGPVREGQRGILTAWDPATQKERWFATLGGPVGGGTLSTAANLVFQVTPVGQLVVYTADKGEKLLELATGHPGGMGPPITYMLDGKQYIALMGGQAAPGGGGGGGRGAATQGAPAAVPPGPTPAGGGRGVAAPPLPQAPAPNPQLLVFTIK